MVEYYRQRARGGAGLIITEGTLPSQQGTLWAHPPGIWSDEHVRAWKKITNAVHEEGAYIYVQLWHVGRISNSEAPQQIASGKPVYAPSPIAARNIGRFRFIPGEPGASVPTEIPDPSEFIEIYRKAAINAKNAGFDGVEVAASGGYLIHQFLDSTTNRRTDDWGGSIENRSKFGLQIIKAVADVLGPGRVGVKLTPGGGYNDIGMPLQETLETYKYFIEELDELDLAYFVLWRYDEADDIIIDGKYRGAPHDVISTYRPFVRKAKLFGVGGYTPDEAAKAISSGRVDGVFFGRPFIANPDFPKRVKFGIPLNAIDMGTLYGPKDGRVLTEDELAKGYIDYPEAALTN